MSIESRTAMLSLATLESLLSALGLRVLGGLLIVSCSSPFLFAQATPAVAPVPATPRVETPRRFYLCTENTQPLARQYLSADRQEGLVKGGLLKDVWGAVVSSTYSDFCSWDGKAPFDVRARQLELWLRFVGAPQRLKIRLSLGATRVHEHEILMPGDGDGHYQVVARWNAQDIEFQRGEDVRIQFAGAGTIIGYSLSHIEFVEESRQPSPYVAVRRIADSAGETRDRSGPEGDQTAQAAQNATSTGSAIPSDGALPRDFKFRALTEARGPIDVGPEAFFERRKVDSPAARGKFSVEVEIMAEGKEVCLSSGRDAVRGLFGHGLRIEQRNEGNSIESLVLHLIWRPESFTCYRDKRLLGVWDVSAKRLRPPKSGEASAAPTSSPARTASPARSDGNAGGEEGFRTWTDATGKHRVEAVFVRVLKGMVVQLRRRDNGAIIEVPWKQLSEDDQKWVYRQVR